MKKWRSVVALVLAALMVLGMVTTIVASFRAYGAGSEISDMQSELDALVKKREKLEKELASIENKKEATMEQKAIIDEQIADLDTEAALLEKLVNTLKNQLAESEERLEQAEKELEENTKLAKERIRAMYELGSTSYWEIVLSARSLHDFVARVEIVRQMSAYDQTVVKNLEETRATIERETKEIAEKKNIQQGALNDLENNITALERKQKQSDALIASFNEKTEANIKAIEAAERAEKELQEEIRAALQSSSNEEFVGGQFLWPMPGYYTITDPFGYRTHPVTGVYKLHTGTDIAGSGINGKPILAANSGKVLKAGNNTAYGKYVVIDHGGGYSTLYAHASALNVSAGQTVSRGDIIAYVGKTGYVTGPHLHFEIIYNGNYLDPLTFFNYNFNYT